jgi:hypothetical protein
LELQIVVSYGSIGPEGSPPNGSALAVGTSCFRFALRRRLSRPWPITFHIVYESIIMKLTRVLILLASSFVAGSFAQSDLTDAKFQAHAAIPQNNLGGSMPISEKLQRAKSTAIRAGIPWKGLNLIGIGSEGGSPGRDGLVRIYQRETCHADAIVVGHPSASVPHLSASQSSIYSDYIFVIGNILKDNPASPIASRRDIVVTRPGGELTLPDGHVTFEDQDFRYFETDVTYVQFLKYIPQSTAYRPIGPFSTLRNDNGNLTIMQHNYSNIALPGFTLAGIGPTVASWLASCE